MFKEIVGAVSIKSQEKKVFVVVLENGITPKDFKQYATPV